MLAFMNDPCVNFFFFSRPFLHRFKFDLFDDFISIFAGVLLLLHVLLKPLLKLWQVLGSFFSVAWKALAYIWKALKYLRDTILPLFKAIYAGVLLLLHVLLKPILKLWQVLGSFFSVAWKALAYIWKALKFLRDTILPFFKAIWAYLPGIHFLLKLLDVPSDVWNWIKIFWIVAKKYIILGFLLVASAIVLLYVFVW